MQHRNLLTAAITLSLLTACGGGGNDSGVTADPRPTSLNSSGNTPTTQTPSSSTAHNDDKKSYESFDFNVFDLGEGKPKITILPPGKVQGADKNRLLTLTDGPYKRIIGNNLSKASYGLIDTTSYDNKYRTFYQGARADLTSSASFFGMMLDGVTPLQGSAHYKGLAVQYSDRDGIEEGTSTFDANFQDRRLSGRINVGQREITIGSMLISNTFSGFGKDAGKSDGLLSFEGAFFVKDASEIAGTYQKASLDDGYIGAFGAQRQ